MSLCSSLPPFLSPSLRLRKQRDTAPLPPGAVLPPYPGTPRPKVPHNIGIVSPYLIHQTRPFSTFLPSSSPPIPPPEDDARQDGKKYRSLACFMTDSVTLVPNPEVEETYNIQEEPKPICVQETSKLGPSREEGPEPSSRRAPVQHCSLSSYSAGSPSRPLLPDTATFSPPRKTSPLPAPTSSPPEGTSSLPATTSSPPEKSNSPFATPSRILGSPHPRMRYRTGSGRNPVEEKLPTSS